MAKNKTVEETEETSEVERYYVIEKIVINNRSTGKVTVNIIQQGQPTTPPVNPPKG